MEGLALSGAFLDTVLAVQAQAEDLRLVAASLRRRSPNPEFCSPRGDVHFPRERGYVRFRGRYWGQSGHTFLQRKCLLMTRSGHWACIAAMVFEPL